MVYFALVGGAAALETTQIEEIEEVDWEELMPECLWKFRVKDFGPLWVGIDSHGDSMYHDVQTEATKSWRRSLPNSDGFLDLPARARSRGTRAHPRPRQGPEPARHRGPLRHGRRLRRHRQAGLGHLVRDPQPREEDRALPLVRHAGRLRRHALRGRRRPREAGRVQELARRPAASRTSRSPTARSRSRASASSS